MENKQVSWAARHLGGAPFLHPTLILSLSKDG